MTYILSCKSVERDASYSCSWVSDTLLDFKACTLEAISKMVTFAFEVEQTLSSVSSFVFDSLWFLRDIFSQMTNVGGLRKYMSFLLWLEGLNVQIVNQVPTDATWSKLYIQRFRTLNGNFVGKLIHTHTHTHIELMKKTKVIGRKKWTKWGGWLEGRSFKVACI